MTISRKAIAEEFARRKVQFHKDENWEDISCFGLFTWGDISRYLVGNPLRVKNFVEGLVSYPDNANYVYSNKTVWVVPTKEFYEKEILPIVKRKEQIVSEFSENYKQED